MSTAAERQAKFAQNSKDSSYGASHSSYYTTEEKKDRYETLDGVLSTKCSDPLIQEVVKDLMKVCADITDALRVALVTVEGNDNEFGDTVLSVDVSLILYIFRATLFSTNNFFSDKKVLLSPMSPKRLLLIS